jgi:serine/threonine-protein kinase
MLGLRLAALVGALLFASVAPAAAQSWGALAFSENGTAYSYSRNYASKEEAERGALAECAKYASDCKIYDTFENRCTSLSGSPNGVYGCAWGGEVAARQQRAIEECTKQGGTECRMVVNFCTGSASDPGSDAPAPGQPPAPGAQPAPGQQPAPKE